MLAAGMKPSHLLTRPMARVQADLRLQVLGYNLTLKRAIKILGALPLMPGMKA
jgi:hypothetical protein